MGQYLPLVVLLVLGILFGAISRLASWLLAPRKPSQAKTAPYECGIVASDAPPAQFPVSFYVVAMLFIMFDVEIIFLYPYAVSYGALGTFGFWAILLFSVIFFLTFIYEVARGGLEWGPMQRRSPVDTDDALVSASRTSGTTIRRVGREGRDEIAASTASDGANDDGKAA